MVDSATLAVATLDTLAPSVAVIDETGEILLTNESWRSFGAEGTPGDDVGTNYLAITKEADDEYAQAAASGLESILAGDRETFTLEYPCHTPDREQWFLMRASRFTVDDAVLVSVTHLEITERRQAEQALEEALADLERVLERIEELLPRVTDAAIGAPSRTALEERVCEALVTDSPYAGAWIGRAGLAGGAVERRASAGQVDTTESIAEQALTDGSVVVEREGETAALALEYGDVTYGVLVVEAATEDTFDPRELLVLESLAGTVGTALNGLEARRLLASDTVVAVDLEVSDDSIGLTALSERLETPVSYRGLREADGELVLYVHLPEGGPQAAEAVPGLAVETVLASQEAGTILEVSVTDDLVALLVEHGAAVRRLEAAGGTLELGLDLPTESAARTLFDAIRDRFETVRLAGYHTRERPVQTPTELAGDLLDSLTERQVEALQLAYHAGYYDWPRGAAAPDLAASMDITPETFHQHLRAAERKLIGGLLEPEHTSLGS